MLAILRFVGILVLLNFNLTGAKSSPKSIISQLNEEKMAIMKRAERATVQVFNDLADPFVGSGPMNSSHGTGFIVDITDGYATVFTNRHVTEIASTEIVETNDGPRLIRLPDFLFRRLTVGKKYGENKVTKKASVEVLFVSPIYDFSVLRFKISDLGAGAEEYFQAIELAESEKEYTKLLQQGKLVLAYGYPQDSTEVGTDGTISALSQKVDGMNSVILHNAPINGGNSGGPLIDMESGKVIGINTWKNDDADNMSFAQPIINAWGEYQRYLKNSQYGSRRLPFMTLRQVGAEFLETTGMADDVEHYIPGFANHRESALLVHHTQKGSPLYSGDLILSVEGELMDGSIEMFQRVYNYSRKSTVAMTILRSGALVEVKLPIFKQEVRTESFNEYAAFSGLVVRNLRFAEKEILGLEEGVIVGATYDDPKSISNPQFIGAVLTEIQGPSGPFIIKNLESLTEYLRETPVGVFLHIRIYAPTQTLVTGTSLEAPVYNIIRPSNLLSVPFSGAISSDEIPLQKFRENYDFTGLDLARSNLGAVIQSACESALMQPE